MYIYAYYASFSRKRQEKRKKFYFYKIKVLIKQFRQCTYTRIMQSVNDEKMKSLQQYEQDRIPLQARL